MKHQYTQDDTIKVVTEATSATIRFEEGRADRDYASVRVIVPGQYMAPADLREAAEAFEAMAQALEVMQLQAAITDVIAATTVEG